MKNSSKIEFYEEYLGFSVGHFTIFSETKRENLHGHNYKLYASLTCQVNKAGLSFDYRHYRDKLQVLCKSLSHRFLLPNESPYLNIVEEEDGYYRVHFDQETLWFLKRDVLIMPLRNITVEELSRWFVDQLLLDKSQLDKDLIEGITVKIFSTSSQSGSSIWSKENA